MWDEEDGFFYDVLRRPDGTGQRLKVRSLVGLLPICAVTVIEPDLIERYPRLAGRIRAYLERNHDLLDDGRRSPRPRRQRPAHPRARQRGQAPADPHARPRRGALLRSPRHPLALAMAPRAPVPARRRGHGLRGAVRTGGVDDRDVRWQLELARAGVDADQPARRPRPAAALPVLRRLVQDRVPDWLGRDDDAVRSRTRALTPLGVDLPPRPGRHASCLRRRRDSSRRTSTGAT